MSYSHSDLWKNFSLGVAASVFLFPIGHPLEVLKVKAQETPHLKILEIAKKTFNEKGLLGFTDTALINFPRRLLREAVRWPVIGYSHNILINQFPFYFQREGIQAKIMTAISATIFDSIFVLPLEQLIAWRIKEKKSYKFFFQERFSKNGVSSLYNGFQINLFRQGLMWLTVMTLNSLCKNKFDEIDREKKHPYLKQLVAGTFIDLGLIGWVLPLDFIKTRIQMEVSLQKKSFLKVIPLLVHQHALSHFYAGAPSVFIQNLFQVTFSSYLIDEIFSHNIGK